MYLGKIIFHLPIYHGRPHRFIILYICAIADISRAYSHLGNTFKEIDTDISYGFHDIVKLSNSLPAETQCFQFYSTSLYSTPQYEYEPIAQFFLDKNYKINNNNTLTLPSTRLRRINMLVAKRNASITDRPMSIAQALRQEHADVFMAAIAEEISSLKTMQTFVEFLGKPTDILKGSLLSSKAISSIIYNPDGIFKKFKARLVARGDMLKNILDPDTFAGKVRADTLRLIFSCGTRPGPCFS